MDKIRHGSWFSGIVDLTIFLNVSFLAAKTQLCVCVCVCLSSMLKFYIATSLYKSVQVSTKVPQGSKALHVT